MKLHLFAGALLAAAIPMGASAQFGGVNGISGVAAAPGYKDPSGAFALLCTGPGTTCTEVARVPLVFGDSMEGYTAPFLFKDLKPGRYKVMVWKDANGNGVVDDGDMQGWHREGQGDPVAVELGVDVGGITGYRVGSPEWEEDNELRAAADVPLLTGTVQVPTELFPDNIQIHACVEREGACDPDNTFMGMINEVDQNRVSFEVELPAAGTATLVAWVDVDGDGTPGPGDWVAVAEKVDPQQTGVALKLAKFGKVRVPRID